VTGFEEMGGVPNIGLRLPIDFEFELARKYNQFFPFIKEGGVIFPICPVSGDLGRRWRGGVGFLGLNYSF